MAERVKVFTILRQFAEYLTNAFKSSENTEQQIGQTAKKNLLIIVKR